MKKSTLVLMVFGISVLTTIIILKVRSYIGVTA